MHSKRLGIRSRIFGLTLSMLVAVLLVTYAYARLRTEAEVRHGTAADLAVRAELVTDRLRVGYRSGWAPEVWDPVADELGRLSQTRVTLIRQDGVVVGDSAVEASSLANLENHAGRPEVSRALQGERAEDSRLSTTIREPMLYRAVPWQVDGKIVGVVRLSVPLTLLDQTIERLGAALTLGLMLSLLAAFGISTFAAQVGSRAARSLTEIANRMRQGDLTARSTLDGDDEFTILGAAINSLAEGLSASLGQLKEEKERLDRVLSGMQEGVIVLDGDGKIILCNRALREMLLVGSGVVGSGYETAFEQAELVNLLAGAISGQSNSKEVSLEVPVTKVLAINVRWLPPRGALALLVDVTEQRRLETVRQEFVANASHELRTPIAAIASAVETLQVGAANDPAARNDFLQMIERNAQRLTALVDDLLSLSLLESGRLDVKLEPIQLGTVVETTLHSLAASARKKETRLLNLVPAYIRVQAAQRGLEHVLGNLVDNAIKYCPPGSEVKVEVVQQRDTVTVTVTDNGPGIPEPHLDRIFERFYRVDAGRSRSVGGTGLGLSIVKHWVEVMQGTISVSCPGGTQFRVTLAAARPRGDA